MSMTHHRKRITKAGHQVTYCGLTTEYNLNIKTVKQTRAVKCKRCRVFGAAYNTIIRRKPDAK